jgi:hypothetical protein
VNAVQYAEQVLRVHAPWGETEKRLADHEAASKDFVDAGNALRYVKQELEDCEFDLITEERGSHPDMKVQEFRDHMKGVLKNNPVYQKALRHLRDLEDVRARSESVMKHNALGLQALAARMHELGGLLTFYAAAKVTDPVMEMAQQRNNDNSER